jgi:V/A-type H+-transporting ATPase subunit K
MSATVVSFCAMPAMAQEEPAHGAAAEATVIAANTQPESSAMLYIGGFLAAALCVSVSVIGAAWAVAKVGTAAMGAVAEKPELMGRSMVYVGLAEGLAIYGLIIAIMILGKL